MSDFHRSSALAEDFSLFVGGPYFRLLSWAGLNGSELQFLWRRILTLSLVAWLPLLLLCALQGRLLHGDTVLSFLPDLGAHVHFLVALPLLLIAEVVVNRRIRDVPRKFLERGLILENDLARFHRAVTSVLKLRDSAFVELLLIAFVALIVVPLRWNLYVADQISSWHAVPTDGQLRPTMAGIWFACVSLPLFQFLLLRWYFRLFVWGRFLWLVSRFELQLMPGHPDRAAGLGFLGTKVGSFASLAVAQGALLSAMIANQILYDKDRLRDFDAEIVVVVVFVLCILLGPLVVFLPQLSNAKKAGLEEYGQLGARYVRAFDAKWGRGSLAQTDALLGTADIQSLADLANSYATMKGMRYVPFTKGTALMLLLATIVPLTPLALTLMPWQDLLQKLAALVL